MELEREGAIKDRRLFVRKFLVDMVLDFHGKLPDTWIKMQKSRKIRIIIVKFTMAYFESHSFCLRNFVLRKLLKWEPKAIQFPMLRYFVPDLRLKDIGVTPPLGSRWFFTVHSKHLDSIQYLSTTNQVC